jgi:pimeloyl-ACP methyl ester carboxylesterase
VNFIRFSRLVLGVTVLAGCTHIATVRRTNPHFTSTSTTDQELTAAESHLSDAKRLERREPKRALGDYLAFAQAAARQLDRQPADRHARDLYNFAVARCIDVIEAAPLDPWNRSLSVPGPDGEFAVTTIRHHGPDRNPADYEIIPADSMTVGGTFFEKRVTLEGLGAPVVGIGREQKSDFRKTFTLRRLYGTATAIIRFDDHRAQIEFIDPFETERVTLDGHTAPLAADFTAPAAVALTREHPEKLGFARLLRPGKYADTARLTRLQTFDPNRIPVIFVHGLQDTPASWVPMLNALCEDPEIRRRYQLWVYSYPSGYPYPYAAALLRKELDAVGRAFPDHKGIVLVGHSMGGIISRLLITDAGDKIWRAYFGKSPALTDLPGEGKKLLEESLIFNHRPEVHRVIFISSPHRGSELAGNWIGRIGAKLVRTSHFLATIPIQTLAAASADPATAHLNRIPNSIDTLSPKNRFVIEINKIPITAGIPFHTIEGDRGRGDAPYSSDGVVPYWSSHLEGAQSELVVPSSHNAQRNPQAIAEVRRILKLHH